MREKVAVVVLVAVCNVVFYMALYRYIPIDDASQIIGIVATGTAGVIWFYLDIWLKDSASPDEPQTIKLKTEKTPSQIVWKAFVARVKMVVVAIALVVVSILILRNH